MTIRTDRSMNSNLARGAVDGKVRFLRPDSVDADETHARDRSGALHTQHFGSMGIGADNRTLIEQHRPDATPRSAAYLPYLGEGSTSRLTYLEMD